MLDVLHPQGQTLTLPYPPVHSEFEVQAFLYNALRRRGFDARGEVQVRGGFGLRRAKASCRFDVVVYDESKRATFIAEVKARPVKHKGGSLRATQQGCRYTQFGVPVYAVYGYEGANELLATLDSSAIKAA